MNNYRKYESEKSGLVQGYRNLECYWHNTFYGLIVKNERTGETLYEEECPECAKRKLYGLDRDSEEFKKIISERKEKKFAAAKKASLLASRIPYEYVGKGFSGFEGGNQDALALCKKFVKGWEKASVSGYGLLFMGPCGTGKTHLACGIIQSLIDVYGNFDARYVRTMDLIRDVRSSWGSKSQFSESEVIDFFVGIPLLVLDEVGVQACTANEQQILFSIIDQRVTRNNPVILISNLNRQDLQSVLGERLFDRIRSKCVPCVFTGPSHRKPVTPDVFD